MAAYVVFPQSMLPASLSNGDNQGAAREGWDGCVFADDLSMAGAAASAVVARAELQPQVATSCPLQR